MHSPFAIDDGAGRKDLNAAIFLAIACFGAAKVDFGWLGRCGKADNTVEQGLLI